MASLAAIYNIPAVKICESVLALTAKAHGGATNKRTICMSSITISEDKKQDHHRIKERTSLPFPHSKLACDTLSPVQSD